MAAAIVVALTTAVALVVLTRDDDGDVADRTELADDPDVDRDIPSDDAPSDDEIPSDDAPSDDEIPSDDAPGTTILVEPDEEDPDTDTDTDDTPPPADFGGAVVTITGPERDGPSVDAINRVLREWGSTVDIDISYVGDADWAANLATQVDRQSPPDISIFPQPGSLAEFARRGVIVPLSGDVVASVQRHWAEDFQRDGIVDGVHVGVPTSTDLKSIVWFVPTMFERAGYAIPRTYAELESLTQQMAGAGGPAPWCVGIESGMATGWVFTDWVEDMVLRLHGGQVYDGWVSNGIPFDDPRIVDAMRAVLQLWTGEADEEAARRRLADNDIPRVVAAGGTISRTSFLAAADPLLDGQCYMHRQASFLSQLFPAGTALADGSPDAIDVFAFPDIHGDSPAVIASTQAAAFNDAPATMAVLEFMATAEYAERRQAAQSELNGGGLSGFLSAARGQDPNVYQPIEQHFLQILSDAGLVRFDASDLMPAAVGAGSFWIEGTSIVDGDITVSEGATRIAASWPR